jgi:hypothetical protein
MENIQIGKVVIVRDSFITDDERDLKGQKGIVRMLYDADPTDQETRDEVMVEWTPETLDSFDDDYFYNAFEEEVSWTSYILPAEVLDRTDETLDEFELAWKKQEIFTRLYLDGLGREGKLIVKAFEKPVDPAQKMPMDCWLDYLNESLRFPVKCKVCFPYDEEDGPLQENCHVTMTGLNSVDRNLGVMAEVEYHGRSYILPLQDLTGGDGYSKDGKYLDAYGLWLVCIS